MQQRNPTCPRGHGWEGREGAVLAVARRKLFRRFMTRNKLCLACAMRCPIACDRIAVHHCISTKIRNGEISSGENEICDALVEVRRSMSGDFKLKQRLDISGRITRAHRHYVDPRQY
jgi:hypothetical protein